MLPTVLLLVFVLCVLLPSFAFCEQLGFRDTVPAAMSQKAPIMGAELNVKVPLAKFVLEKLHYSCEVGTNLAQVCLFDSLVPGTAPLWCRADLPCAGWADLTTISFTNLDELPIPDPPGSPLYAFAQCSGNCGSLVGLGLTDSVPCDPPAPAAIIVRDSSGPDIQSGIPDGLRFLTDCCVHLAFDYSLRATPPAVSSCDTDDLTCYDNFLFICDRNAGTYSGWDQHCEYGCVDSATECLGEFDNGALCLFQGKKCDENNAILHQCINYEIDGGEQCEFGCRPTGQASCYAQFEVGADCNGDLCGATDEKAYWQCVNGQLVAPVVCEFGCSVENAVSGSCLAEFEEFALCNDSVCFSNTLWECVVGGEGTSRFLAPLSCENCSCFCGVDGNGVSAGNVASYAMNGVLGALAVGAILSVLVVVVVGFLCHLNKNGKETRESPPEEKTNDELPPLSSQSPFVSVVREVVYGKPMSGTESRRMSMRLQQLTFAPLNSVYSEIRFVLDGGGRKRGLQLMMGAGVRSRWITEAEIGSVDVNVMDDEGIVQVQMEMTNGSLQVLDFDAEDHGALTQCMSCLLEIGA